MTVHATDSTVTLTITPSGIQPGLTSDLTLTCGVNDVITASSGGIVGRGLPDTSSQFAQAATQTTDQLATVTSLVVTRNGGNVASVTTVTPAHALTDPNLTVTGSLGGGVAGNLSLAWTD